MSELAMTDQELAALLDVGLEEQARRSRRQKVEALSPGGAAWLVLCPVWTPALAEATGFPKRGRKGAGEALFELHWAGICELDASLPDASGEERDDLDEFRVPMALRAELLEGALDELGGHKALLSTLTTIAWRVKRALEKEPRLAPASLARWAELAVHASSPEETRQTLLQRARKAIESGRPNEALQWIEAAAWLEDVAGAPVAAARGQAGRMVERYHRRRRDEERLAAFFEREEQTRAFDALMRQAPESPWALHFIGPGGVGKTMLMRFIAARLAPAHHATVARLDFDHVNPDYPTRSPGLLLSLLATELRLNDEGDTVGSVARLFRRFDLALLELHERAGGGAVDPEALDPLLRFFAAGARALGRPILLLIDTCEELVKHRASAGSPPNVRAMLELLERVHGLLPSLRVVFCGRRPLASAGAGWRVEGAAEALPTKSYMRLFQVRGFTREEAVAFLRGERGSPRATQRPSVGAPRRVPEELIEPILRRSPAVGLGYRFVWEGGGGGGAEVEPRYSPIEVARFAAWVADEPDVKPEEIAAADANQYVVVRIASRLRSPSSRALLPIVGLLGGFDVPTLRKAAPEASEAAIADAFHELARQEWAEVHGGTLGEVEPGLWPRLRAWSRKTGGAELDRAARRVGDYLEEQTLGAPLEALHVFHFKALLRLCPRGLEPALAWWERVEARLAKARAFDWAYTLTDQLLAEEDILPLAPGPATRLRAAIKATYSGALLNCRGRGTDTLWADVAREVTGDDAAAVHLRARAAAGLVTTAWIKGAPIDRGDALLEIIERTPADAVGDMLGASFVAGLEALTEEAERAATDEEPSARLLDGIIGFAEKLTKSRVSPRLRAFGLSLAGRAHARAGRWSGRERRGNKAARLLEEAVALSSSGELGPWLDWISPEHIEARVRLEYVRALYPEHRSAEDALAFLEASPAPYRGTLDDDRLESALAALRGAVRPAREAEVGRMEQRKSGLGRRRGNARYNAHATYPPLAVARALALADEGLIGPALDALQQVGREAERSADALDEVSEAQRATLLLVRRMRLSDERLALDAGVALSIDDWAMRLALEALQGAPGRSSRELWDVPKGERPFLTSAHARLRASAVWDEGELSYLQDWLSTVDPTLERFGFETASLLLDFAEKETRDPGSLGPFYRREPIVPRVRRWCNQRRFGVRETLILILRCLALGEPSSYSGLITLAERVGERRAGWIACDEGELLALRLPRQGAALLREAAWRFRNSKEAVGSLLASACEAMAWARASDPPACESTLVRVREEYQALLRLGLLEWVELVAIVDSPDPTFLEQIAAEWRPWIIRILCCLAWLRDQDEPRAGRIARLCEILQTQMGVLPTELQGWVDKPERVGGRAGRRTVLGMDSPAIPATPQVTAAIIEGGALESMQEPARQISLAPGIEIRALRRVTRRRRSPEPVLFAPKATQFECNFWGPWPERRVPAVILTAPRGGVWEDVPEAFIEYAKELVHSVPRLSGADPREPALFQLRLDADASAPAWEALIATKTREGDDAVSLLDSIAFVRTPYQARHPRRSLDRRRDVEVVSLVGSFEQTKDAREAWERARPVSSVVRHSVGASADFLLRRRSTRAQVLHIVADAFTTSAGVRLTTGGEEMIEQAQASRGDSLDAHTIMREIPNLVVVVLQAPPSRTITRTEADRDQADYLRFFAMELCDAGVQTVFTVPAVPPHLATSVLRVIATASLLQRGARKRMVAQARRALFDESFELLKINARVELAMDLAHYESYVPADSDDDDDDAGAE
jgi:hypothetical protein